MRSSQFQGSHKEALRREEVKQYLRALQLQTQPFAGNPAASLTLLSPAVAE